MESSRLTILNNKKNELVYKGFTTALVLLRMEAFFQSKKRRIRPGRGFYSLLRIFESALNDAYVNANLNSSRISPRI